MEWFALDPAAIPVTSASPVECTVKLSGAATSVRIELADGDTVFLTHHGGDVWRTMLAAAQVLFEYDSAGANHDFVGFLDVMVGDVQALRRNPFISVMDDSAPAVGVYQLSAEVRLTDHVVNLWVPGLTIPPTFEDLRSVTRTFYERFDDDYDVLSIVYSLPSFPANRTHFAVSNDVLGIGLALFDNTAVYSSSGRLQGISQYPIDSFFDLASTGSLHEVGHQWISFLTHELLEPGPRWSLGTLARGLMGFQLPGIPRGCSSPSTWFLSAGGSTRCRVLRCCGSSRTSISI